VAAPSVDLVLHTGSVQTGREIARACGERLKKALVELGGKDPLIVDAGVDPRWAGRASRRGRLCQGGAPGGAAQPPGASRLGLGYGPELLDEVTFTKVVHVEPAPA
jgi:aldehyde dehydrogenase family protein